MSCEPATPVNRQLNPVPASVRSRPAAWLAVIAGAAVSMAIPPAGSSRADEAENADLLAPEVFDETMPDDWSLTQSQQRLLGAVGVVVGMVSFAAVAAFLVTRLADRGPVGGPARLADLLPPPQRGEEPPLAAPPSSTAAP
jgi:hypothetical protein